MIGSKTYQGLAGLNYIQGSDLVLTDVYLVKREGTQYDKWISGSTNRTYVYNDIEGRVYFPTGFNAGGEKVFVLFKKTTTVPEPIPGVCVAVAIDTPTLPDAINGVPYSYSINLAGTAPFTISAITSPSWMSVTVSGSIVNLVGTPDAEGTETIAFTITNCSGNTDSFTQDIDVLAASSEITISNNSASGVFITSVTGIPWTLYTGSFPLGYPSNISGAHGAFTGVITVEVTGLVFPYIFKLYKNNILVNAFPTSGDDDYDFSSQTFLSTDTIQIVLEPKKVYPARMIETGIGKPCSIIYIDSIKRKFESYRMVLFHPVGLKQFYSHRTTVTLI